MVYNEYINESRIIDATHVASGKFTRNETHNNILNFRRKYEEEKNEIYNWKYISWL